MASYGHGLAGADVDVLLEQQGLGRLERLVGIEQPLHIGALAEHGVDPSRKQVEALRGVREVSLQGAHLLPHPFPLTQQGPMSEPECQQGKSQQGVQCQYAQRRVFHPASADLYDF